MTAGAPARRRRAREEISFLPIRALVAGLGGRDPETAVRIGGAIGRSVARLPGSAVETARVNLGLAFPEWSESRREQALSDCFANLGRVAAELALLQGPRRAQLLANVEMHGADNLAAAEAASPDGGVMVLTAHFGSWDLCAAAMAAQGVELSVVHRGFGHADLRSMMTEVRGAADAGGVREIDMGARAAADVLRALRGGRKVAMLLDQNARRREGVFVPFFGIPACTRSAPALIAMRRGIPVLPAFIHRVGKGAQHVVKVLPHLCMEAPGPEPEAALLRNVASMTEVIESAIRSAPDHWLWPHRRWRTRPEATPEALYPVRGGVLRRLRRGLLGALR
jgi:KDO2-lipid IV(A) lauroyltransferase